MLVEGILMNTKSILNQISPFMWCLIILIIFIIITVVVTVIYRLKKIEIENRKLAEIILSGVLAVATISSYIGNINSQRINENLQDKNYKLSKSVQEINAQISTNQYANNFSVWFYSNDNVKKEDNVFFVNKNALALSNVYIFLTNQKIDSFDKLESLRKNSVVGDDDIRTMEILATTNGIVEPLVFKAKTNSSKRKFISVLFTDPQGNTFFRSNSGSLQRLISASSQSEEKANLYYKKIKLQPGKIYRGD